MYTSTEVLIDKVISCLYNGKPRYGKVVKATQNCLTILCTDNDGKTFYRSFTIANIVGMRVEGYTL